ncbi:hypothetical protein GUITHDRAFT_47473, partial [Guillardia theta CCMP2712]
SGDKPRDPRRVYANPVYPEICPILALGIYLLCYLPDELSLFPGRSQYKRFMQVLSKIMMPPNQSESAAPIFNTYLRYEAAGDAFVGRTITGLPIDSSEFAILPPHFKEADSSGMVTSAIQMLFPTLPMCMYGVAEFA